MIKRKTTNILVKHVPWWSLYVLLFFITSGLGYAGTIYVPEHYATIQAGIDAAVAGDIVLVASGAYSGTGNKNLRFYGKAITVQSVTGPQSTTIDCQGDGRGVLFAGGEGADSRFVGFTVTNGYVDGNSLYGGKGGGILCSGSSPTIANCVISKCKADGFGGGGIALYSSSARVENTIVEYNITEATGGGILIVDASPTIYNSIVRNNKTSGYSSGGGICVIRSNPTLSYCTISYNEANIDYPQTDPLKATNSGGISFREGSTGRLESSVVSYNKAQERGGVGSWDAAPTITNCLIEKNEATVHGGGGLGFYFNSDAIVSGSTIKDNLAKEYGGGVSVWNETASATGPSFTDCIIENNVAGDSGGGLYFLDSSPEISGCIIRGNSSPQRAGIGLKAINGTTSSVLVNDLIYNNTATTLSGGGIACINGADATIANCTVVNNTSTYDNGALFVSSANVSVMNSIFWGNIPEGFVSPIATITYSDVSGGYSGAGNINNDPLFVSSTDFHLTGSSPCVDNGNNSATLMPLVDLGGNNRISGGTVDLGAYEYPYVSGESGISGGIGANIAPYNPLLDSPNITPIMFLLLRTP